MSITRRRFLQTASAAALLTQVDWRSARAQEASSTAKNLIDPSKKLRIAGIGVGGQGAANLNLCADEDIVALCDVDFVRAAKTFQRWPDAARYRDFRQMLREMHDEIDAVVISTPDHMHFPAAMMAIEAGKHVYVEKPLTHTIGEARLLREAARKAGVITQMGNHGHANEGTRLVKEWIDAGVIGPIRKVHCWTNRPIWKQGLNLPTERKPVPATLDWNLWQGVAPEQEYSPEFLPFAWRGWWAYGCGALGDMGCHVMDAPFWALNLRGSFNVSAESEGTNQVSAPTWSVVRYEFPQRGELPPVTLTWFDGGVKPPKPPEMGDAELPIGGTLYYGEKGIILSSGDYSESPRLIPEEKMRAFRDRPEKTIPRIKGGNARREWIDACKGGPIPGSNIVEYSAELTELVLAGNLAIRMGRPLQYDAATGTCIGCPDADRLINKTYRIF
jgi:Predicted dehydrogenases and related proteins